MTGAARIDLDGNPAGIVTEAEARYAARGVKILKDKKVKKLKKLLPKRDSLTALKEAARRRREVSVPTGGGA
jgi:sRNA-binding protein